MDSDDDFLGPSKKKSKKAKPAAASFLDDLLAEDEAKAEQQRAHDVQVRKTEQATEVTVGAFEIDWAYINGTSAAAAAAAEQRLSQLSQDDDDADAPPPLDENFDALIGARLPERVAAAASAEGRAAAVAAARGALCAAAGGDVHECALLGFFQRLAAEDDAIAIAEALACAYAARFGDATASKTFPPAFARWLHVTAAFDDRDAVSHGAAVTLAALAASPRISASLVDAETVAAIFGGFFGADAVAAGPPLEARRAAAGGGGADDAATARTQFAVARLGRALDCLTRAVAHGGCALCEDALVEVAKLAACVAACDADVTKDEGTALAAAKLARAAAARRAAPRSAAELWAAPAAVLCQTPDAEGGPPAARRGTAFDCGEAAQLVIGLRALPLGTPGARAATARAARDVLVDRVLAKTDFPRLYDEAGAAGRRRLADGGHAPHVCDVALTLHAALATAELDAGGGNSDEAVLGSHSRLYAALACMKLLYACCGAEVAHAEQALLHEAAAKLNRRLRHEMDPTASRCKELLESWTTELEHAGVQSKTQTKIAFAAAPAAAAA
ncbi:hypothetical protein M885DRAFT_548267 [Pelagophyceae sp. CCMP2097]|nr:hypothetical protein M885DRAFT_548267 [Pelagophyceae sp. CCMP2097]